MESPSRPQTTITPVELDMRFPDERLRETGRAALQDTLTPMLAIRNHGCSAQLAELATRARAHHSLDGGPLPPQSACDFDGPLEPLAEETRAKLAALCTRLLDILTGEAPILEGRLCMRTYPGETLQEESGEGAPLHHMPTPSPKPSPSLDAFPLRITVARYASARLLPTGDGVTRRTSEGQH